MSQRIGRLTTEGRVEFWPDEYATGGQYRFRDDPGATRVVMDGVHFYVLPTGQANVSEELRAELEAEAASAATPVTTRSPIKSGGKVTPSSESSSDA